MMDEEADIGLYNLAQSPPSSPPKRKSRRPSAVSITRGLSLSGTMKSPSSSNILDSSPKSARKLSRSNTLPRLISQGGDTLDDLDKLSIASEQVETLRRWILALVIGMLDFDLEYGPKIVKVYPPLTLEDAEEENIAFSAFPDASQAEQGSQVHSFRIRKQNTLKQEAIADRPDCEDGFIYGFSHFTQRRDSNSKRGYQQRSLVILTQHPYPSLYYTLISCLGPAFVNHGGPMLEVACHNIAKWSDPLPGSTVEMGFLGYVFSADIPSTHDTPQSTPTSSAMMLKKHHSDSHIMVSLSPADPPILYAFEACLSHIWSIWECLVLCEPILVFGPEAAMTSQAIWWLRDIIRPLPLASDFRPFFTIHDADHAALVNARQPQAGLVLGVTNPFFVRACQHWPHTIGLGPPLSRKDKTIRCAYTPGWKTKTHKRYISRDAPLLKKLEEATKRDERAKLEASNALRQHLSSRTTALLVPLQRYLNTLIPSPSESSAHNSRSTTPAHAPSSGSSASNSAASLSTPSSSSNSSSASHKHTSPLRLKPFSETAFLASLKAHGSPLPFKSSGRQREFYQRWVRTRAFGLWIAGQEEAVDRVLAQKSRERSA